MIYVIYSFGVLFILLSGLMLYVYWRSRHAGMFILGSIYGTSGLIAIAIPHWWPLLTGFALAWLLRLMGLEPRFEPPAGESGGKPEE
jgi:hypothetical protein